MNETPKMKPCPFCGAEMEAFIYKGNVPEYWRNGYWFLRDNHDEKCFLSQNDMFGYVHFGKAENGEPTAELLEFVEKWNRRAE